MFSKSKRFQDKSDLTPGPGKYNVKLSKEVSLASFPKGHRFADSSDNESVGSAASSSFTRTSEFKVPKPTKRKSRKKTVSVQTDVCEERNPIEAIQQDVIHSRRSQSSTLQDELDLLKREFDVQKAELEAQLHETNTQLSAVQSQCEQHLANSAHLQSQISDMTKENRRVGEELTLSLNTVSRYEAELSSLKHSLGEANSAVSKLERELAEEKSSGDDLRDKTKQLEACKEKLQAEILGLTNTIQLQDDSINSLTISLERETQLRVSTESASMNKNETINCLKTAISQLQENIFKWEQLRDSSAERQKELEQQVTSTNSSLANLTIELKNLKIANHQSRAENQQLQSTNQSASCKIEELQNIISESESKLAEVTKKLKEANSLEDVVRQKEARIEELLELNNVMSGKLDSLKTLKHQLSEMDETVNSLVKKHKEEVLSFEGRLSNARTEVKEAEAKNRDLESELSHQRDSVKALIEEYSLKITSLQTQLATTARQNSEKVDELSNLADGLREERDVASRKAEEVQALYDELEKKIAPFKEQLDAFDLEKRLLEGQSKNWASEAAKATQECATLLGHQNQKQKIRRINQMGEENFQLKKEVMNLRGSDSKLRRQILQLQEKVRLLEGKRRFDSSRAFQKENVENEERVPLKAHNSTDR